MLLRNRRNRSFVEIQGFYKAAQGAIGLVLLLDLSEKQ